MSDDEASHRSSFAAMRCEMRANVWPDLFQKQSTIELHNQFSQDKHNTKRKKEKKKEIKMSLSLGFIGKFYRPLSFALLSLISLLYFVS
jgi:hypothetical protein